MAKVNQDLKLVFLCPLALYAGRKEQRYTLQSNFFTGAPFQIALLYFLVIWVSKNSTRLLRTFEEKKHFPCSPETDPYGTLLKFSKTINYTCMEVA